MFPHVGIPMNLKQKWENLTRTSFKLVLVDLSAAPLE